MSWLKKYGRNGLEVIAVNGTKWLNEKHIEEGLGHANLSALTRRYSSNYRKHRYEFCRWTKKTKTIKQNIFTWRLSNKNNNVDCRTDESSDFKLSLGFKLYDMVHRKQQTITRSIKDALEGKSMQN